MIFGLSIIHGRDALLVLGDLIHEMKAQGCSIIMISHRLEDIHQVSDRMMVMRHGRKVCDKPITGDLHEFREQVVAYMIGAKDDFAQETID